METSSCQNALVTGYWNEMRFRDLVPTYTSCTKKVDFLQAVLRSDASDMATRARPRSMAPAPSVATSFMIPDLCGNLWALSGRLPKMA